MEIKGFDIGSLHLKKPIVQGGMGVGISLSGLAAAVAAEGGLGVISAAHPGFKEPDFEENTKAANVRALKHHIKKAKADSNGGVIGVNIMCAMNGYEDYVRASCEAGADIIISGAGLPAELPKLTEGYDIKLAPIISPPKAARILLKLWDKRYGRTADMLVIEGPKAGGHLGYSREEATELCNKGYDKEILEIKEIVKLYEEKYNKHIPIVFGGGVSGHEDFCHYMELGLDGVQVASRFVATKECDAAEAFKEAYINASKENIGLVSSPVGMPGRAIRNSFIKDVENKRPHIDKCYKCIKNCNPTDTPYCISKALINAAKGDTEHGLIFCGSETYRIKCITDVKTVIKEIIEG
ncbi:MAG: nitronate monooxygenase [Eubacteriales bacterium]|nr:nitronate monooxygenase [Eubacteriales bacterium]